MLFNLLGLIFLTALKFPVVSDRQDFTCSDHISTQTQQCMVNLENGEAASLHLSELLELVAGKETLLLIHGYNNTFSEAISSYQKYHAHLANSYDQIIGYVWPGGDHGTEYFSARDRVINDLDLRLLALLTQMRAVTKTIDIYTHSMGSRLALEALELSPGPLVRNLFLTAPAVDNESLQTGERYNDSAANCEKIVVFHSKNDSMLGDIYRLGELDRALGYKGPEDPELMPANVTVIDGTEHVSGHSNYADASFIFEEIASFIKR